MSLHFINITIPPHIVNSIGMAPPSPALRLEVLKVYKGWLTPRYRRSKLTMEIELLFLVREYPLGYDYARPRLHKAFMSQAGIQDEEKIKQGILRAEFVKKGMATPT
jgi:hypothetical protein